MFMRDFCFHYFDYNFDSRVKIEMALSTFRLFLKHSIYLASLWVVAGWPVDRSTNMIQYANIYVNVILTI